MGNHFRTSGAGDDAPKTQAGVQGSRFATPDSEGQPVAQAPAQPADQAQPASDPFAYNPTSDVALSGAAGAGFGPVVPHRDHYRPPESVVEVLGRGLAQALVLVIFQQRFRGAQKILRRINHGSLSFR